MQSASPGADQQRPEVEASVASEGQKDRQIELNHESPGDGGAGGQHTILNGIVRERSRRCLSGRHRWPRVCRESRMLKTSSFADHDGEGELAHSQR